MNGNITTVKGNREIPRTFSQNLKHYRLQKNLTYKQLGEMAKIDAGYIHKLEKGIRRAPSYPIIRNLSRALNVNITDLIDLDPIEEDLPRKSIQEVLVYNEYLIKGKLPTMEARENLLALIQTLLDSEWKEHSKHMDAVKILNKIDTFLKALQ
ncbi:helix-turn-helix domain-containing protein [Metabacillus halosaccharovorans]|uniref:helix-turn-helix domain-containing protein n=1 Tax=Metabacillus halosaccharovorans TaxID=930124 RepID=UPI00403E10FB